MKFRVYHLSLIMLLAWSAPGFSEDWPTYQHDNYRSGVTGERLNVEVLQEAWVYRSPHPPQPAWAGPAKWDAYANLRGLRSMRGYDLVFHVIAVDDSVYFGSSAEDSVYRLDAKTGDERWCYTTSGSVRLAPTFAKGHIYFGADDGHAYCLQADDGSLVWKMKPSEDDRLIPSNGKFISIWPCRTGVLVADDRAYFAVSLLPWREAYLCAVDADTGSDEGPGLYVKKLRQITMEGHLLASSTKLYVPQGRVPPIVFDRQQGSPLGALSGGGGVFALLTSDAHFLHGPGNKAGWIVESNAESRDKIAQFNSGNAMLVSNGLAYLLTDTSLSAINRANGETLWSVPCQYPYALIMAGGMLFTGGDSEVAAFGSVNGERVWSSKVDGRAHGLAVANGQLLVSTTTGAIHAFR